jgi:hypothetical protein
MDPAGDRLLRDALTAVASLEERLADVRAQGEGQPLIDDLQQIVNEIRNALSRALEKS